MYSSSRFVTLTGRPHRLLETNPDVEDVDAAVMHVWSTYVAGPSSNRVTPDGAVALASLPSPPLSDEFVLEKAVAASNGAKVAALMTGDLSDHGGTSWPPTWRSCLGSRSSHRTPRSSTV